MSLKARLLPLLGGNLFAQVLQIGIIPVLTRLYGPERYGEYGLFAAMLLSSSMLATLRYELAIQLPKTDGVARCVAGLSFGLALVVSVLVFILVQFFLPYLNPSLNSVEFGFLLALSTLLLGCYNVLLALSLRSGLYKLNGYSRVVQVAVGAGSGVGFFWLGFDGFGLLYANVLGYFCAFCILLAYQKDLLISLRLPRDVFHDLSVVARRYSGFAIFNAPQAVMDGLRPIAIVSLIQAGFGVVASGHYHIANQLLQTPASVVSQAFTQVHYRYLVENLGSRGMVSIVRRHLIILLALAAMCIFGVWLLSEYVVSVLFGNRWVGLGHTLDAIAPLVAVNLVAAPLVYVFHALRKHREFLVWGGLYNFVALVSLWVGCSSFSIESEALRVYAICASLVLCMLIIRSVRLSVASGHVEQSS